MDALTSLRVFREVVEAGSFVKAAERLDISTAMTSKHVANLERQLGVRLLNRTTQHLSLTETGNVYNVYYEQCSEALDILPAAESAVVVQTAQPQGVLKVTAPGWFANRTFADLLVAYQQQYPGVLVDLRLENRFVDLVEEGYDMAIRATSEPSLSLIVRPLCKMPFVLAGARAYLDKHGEPRHPNDIAHHQLVLPHLYQYRDGHVEWPGRRVRGEESCGAQDQRHLDSAATRAHRHGPRVLSGVDRGT